MDLVLKGKISDSEEGDLISFITEFENTNAFKTELFNNLRITFNFYVCG